MKQIRKHITYANVMSSIAVFLVLGGGAAYAAKKIGSNEIKGNSITTGKIKKEAVTTSKIKNNSISTAKIQNDAVTGAKVKDGSLTGSDINLTTVGTVPNATNAANAGKLNGVAASEYLSSFALVTPDGKVVEGKGVQAVVNFGAGLFAVRFTRPVAGKAYSATIAGEDVGQAQINAQPCIAPAPLNDSTCPAEFENANSLFVNTEDSSGTNADRAFMVALIPAG